MITLQPKNQQFDRPNGDLPNPTPAEVQADFAENQRIATKEGGGIDWQRLHALIPWFAVIGAVVMWAMFLLIPTAFGLHYAGMFPAMSNWSYVAMGLTLCLAAFRAAKTHQGVHAIGFTFAVLLLSYWF